MFLLPFLSRMSANNLVLQVLQKIPKTIWSKEQSCDNSLLPQPLLPPPSLSPLSLLLVLVSPSPSIPSPPPPLLLTPSPSFFFHVLPPPLQSPLTPPPFLSPPPTSFLSPASPPHSSHPPNFSAEDSLTALECRHFVPYRLLIFLFKTTSSENLRRLHLLLLLHTPRIHSLRRRVGRG